MIIIIIIFIRSVHCLIRAEIIDKPNEQIHSAQKLSDHLFFHKKMSLFRTGITLVLKGVQKLKKKNNLESEVSTS